jgi:hypothetical protein
VVVGDALADQYKARLKQLATGARDPPAGPVYGEGYVSCAPAPRRVQATDVGGTHPALLEAMAAGSR